MADLTVTAANVREGNAVFNRRISILPDDTITAGQPVYRKTSGKAGLGRANAVGTSKLVGIALAAGAAGGPAIEAIYHGPLFGIDLSGMDPGETVYLSAATAGALSDTAITGTGNVVVRVGTVHVMTDAAATKYLLVDIAQNAEPVAL